MGGVDYIPTVLLTKFIPYIGDPESGVVKQELQYYTNDFNKKFYVDVGGKYFGFFIL